MRENNLASIVHIHMAQTCAAFADDPTTVKNESTKVQMLGTELVHANTMYSISIDSTFTMTTLYLVITLVGTGHQLNRRRGNFND